MKNQLKTLFLLGVLSALLVSVGGLLGPGYLYVFTALALLLNLGAYFWSDRIVLRMNGARPLEPDHLPWLHQMVGELARNAGIPAPRLCIVEDEQPNAFATGRNPANGVVAVTTGILRLLDRRELRGVIAHELAHIKNRDILVSTIAAAIAAAVSYIVNIAQLSFLFGGAQQDDAQEEGGSPLAGLLMLIVAPIAATLVQLGISRSREFLADQTGARICGDPEALALALEKLERGAELVPGAAQPATASLYIVNPLAGAGGVLALFSTHPPMAQRIERLRAMVRASRAYQPA
jgi:heat shock protein HtpX